MSQEIDELVKAALKTVEELKVEVERLKKAVDKLDGKLGEFNG